MGQLLRSVSSSLHAPESQAAGTQRSVWRDPHPQPASWARSGSSSGCPLGHLLLKRGGRGAAALSPPEGLLLGCGPPACFAPASLPSVRLFQCHVSQIRATRSRSLEGWGLGGVGARSVAHPPPQAQNRALCPKGLLLLSPHWPWADPPSACSQRPASL